MMYKTEFKCKTFHFHGLDCILGGFGEDAHENRRPRSKFWACECQNNFSGGNPEFQSIEPYGKHMTVQCTESYGEHANYTQYNVWRLMNITWNQIHIHDSHLDETESEAAVHML